jgi:hypothetical protein
VTLGNVFLPMLHEKWHLGDNKRIEMPTKCGRGMVGFWRESMAWTILRVAKTADGLYRMPGGSVAAIPPVTERLYPVGV